MSFHEYRKTFPGFDVRAFLARVTRRRAEQALAREGDLTPEEFLALLSEPAQGLLEPMAQKARNLTRRFFGNVVFLFTPMYLSNYCDNRCRYCSFGAQQNIPRRQLTFDEIRLEAQKIAESGIRHVLLLTGESRGHASLEYLRKSVRLLREYFSSIAVEIYPLTEPEYGALVDEGVDGLTIYQEVYDEEVYRTLHAGGPKADYRFRLEAPERALARKMRTVTIGPLLGLNDPLAEAWMTALHLRYLKARYGDAEISVSLPRIRPLVSDFQAGFPVSDRFFVQMLLAFRLFCPSAGITVSTRESGAFRRSILPLGITRMSAGVSTAVGGRSSPENTAQFEIADTRNVADVQADLRRLGYQPVMHDWHHRLSTAGIE
jgi:2-iminoacetate synthase